MNWVGGVKRRILQREEERRRQQIYFAQHAAARTKRSSKERSQTGGLTYCYLPNDSKSEPRLLGTAGPHLAKIKPQHWRKEEMIYERIRTGSRTNASTASLNKTAPTGQDSHTTNQGSSLYTSTRHDEDTRNEGNTEDKRAARIKPTSIHGPFSKYLLKLERQAVERRLAEERKRRKPRKHRGTKSPVREDRAHERKGGKPLSGRNECSQDESTRKLNKTTRNVKSKGERRLNKKGEASTSGESQMNSEKKDQKKYDAKGSKLKKGQDDHFKELVNLSLSGTELKFTKIPNWISSNANVDASVRSGSSCSVVTRSQTEKERKVETTRICSEVQVTSVESSNGKGMTELQKSQRKYGKDFRKYQQVLGKVAGKKRTTEELESTNRGHRKRSADRLQPSSIKGFGRNGRSCDSEKECQVDEASWPHDSSKENRNKHNKQKTDSEMMYNEALKKENKATKACHTQSLPQDEVREIREFQGPCKNSYDNTSRQKEGICSTTSQQRKESENRETLPSVARCSDSTDNMREKMICDFSTPTLLAGAPRLRQVLTLSPDRHKGNIWAPMHLPANQPPMFTSQPNPQRVETSAQHLPRKTEETRTGDNNAASSGFGSHKQKPHFSVIKCTPNSRGSEEKLSRKWENDRLQMLLGIHSQRSVSESPYEEVDGNMTSGGKGYHYKEGIGMHTCGKIGRSRDCKPAEDPSLVNPEISILDGSSDTQANKITGIINPIQTKENCNSENFQTSARDSIMSKPKLSDFTRKIIKVDSGLGFARERKDKTPYLDRSICTPWLSGVFFNTPGSNKSSSKTPTDPTIEGSLENIFSSQGGGECVNVNTPGCPPEPYQSQFSVFDSLGGKEPDADLPCHFSLKRNNSTMYMDSRGQHTFSSTLLHDQDCQLPGTSLEEMNFPPSHGTNEKTTNIEGEVSYQGQSYYKLSHNIQDNFAGNMQLSYNSHEWYESGNRTYVDPTLTAAALGDIPSSKGLPKESELQKLFLRSTVEGNQQHPRVNPDLAARQFREVMGLGQLEASQESWGETTHASQLSSSSSSSQSGQLYITAPIN
ncbi:hypothetical protein Pcinc_037228 [Petrolisthes cinctipes]|uniref:Uncharacterized protein n=1 Tax=Petrolisthes cinctipes TaxID=88211 RepID=A0AAE1BT68_PETCI|nr:hypothetical protein Pcinc_037228 [Petrolisthes cinctipes]